MKGELRVAICKVCGIEIVKGERYIGEKYKNFSFCSEECYNRYVADREASAKHRSDLREQNKQDYRKFTDVLAYIYPSEHQNWTNFQTQAKKIIDDYGLDYKQMKNIIVFAIKYDNHEFNPLFGLGQFFPRYIEGYNKFMRDVKEIMDEAEEMDNEEYSVVIKPKSNKRFEVKREEFDD